VFSRSTSETLRRKAGHACRRLLAGERNTASITLLPTAENITFGLNGLN
jgi:hypothetical protein